MLAARRQAGIDIEARWAAGLAPGHASVEATSVEAAPLETTALGSRERSPIGTRLRAGALGAARVDAQALDGKAAVTGRLGGDDRTDAAAAGQSGIGPTGDVEAGPDLETPGISADIGLDGDAAVLVALEPLDGGNRALGLSLIHI